MRGGRRTGSIRPGLRRRALKASCGALALEAALLAHGAARAETAAEETPRSESAGPVAALAAAAAQLSDAPVATNRLRSPLTPLQVPLLLNGKYLGDITAEVDLEGRGRIDWPRLQALLKPVLDGAVADALAARAAGRERVDFERLNGDGFRIAFDPATLEMRAEVGAADLATAEVALRGSRATPDPALYDAPEPFAAGVNVGLSQRYAHDDPDDGFQPLRASFDGLVNFGGFGGVTLTGTAFYDGSADDRWSRGEIQLTKDVFDRAVRLRAGEFRPSVRAFQGSSRFLGVSAERAFSAIRPFQNVRPSGRSDFVLERESVVEVEVNGVRVETLRLTPGRYSMSDFPFASGPNEVRLVVQDDSGRREVAVFDLFGGAGELLTPGTTDFGFSAGVVERDAFAYGGSPAATGYLWRGLTQTTTVGVNAQASRTAAQAGASGLFGTRWGLFQIEASASRTAGDGRWGRAASADWTHAFSLREKDDLRITAAVLARSGAFQDAFAAPSLNTQSWQAAAQAQLRLPAQTFAGAGVARNETRGGGRDAWRWDFNLGKSFRRFSLSANLGRESRSGSGGETRFSLGLSLPLTGRWSAAARYDSAARRREVELTRTQSSALGDLSGTLRATQDKDSRGLSARALYANNRFDLEAAHNRLVAFQPGGDSTTESSWRASSFIGFAGGRLAFGRPVTDAFMVVDRHPTLKSAQVTLKNGDQAVARTGLFGPALVPVQRAYGLNTVSVTVDPLPPGYDIGEGVLSVFPGLGSGYAFTIGSNASRVAMGVLRTAEGPVAYVGGTVEAVANPAFEPRPFFTNRSGRFVADRLAPGRYRLVVGGRTAAEFTVPEDGEGVTDVGALTVDAD